MNTRSKNYTKPKSSMGKRVLYIIFSLLACFGIFYYLLSHVSLTDVIELIKGVDRSALVIFFLLSFSTSFFRLWRYTIVLKFSGYSPSSIALFLVVLVRNFFSDLLPARIGTLIYIYMVNTRLGIPFGVAASSFAIAFLFDMLALAPLIVLAAWAAAAGTQIPALPLIIGGLILGLLTLAVLMALPYLCRMASRLVSTISFISLKQREMLIEAFQSTGEELKRAKQGGIYGQVLTISVLVRVSKYASLYVFLFALLKPLAYSLSDLKISHVFLGLCASELAASLPISGIAGFGVYEGAWALTFELLGFPGNIAKLTAISHHLFTQIYGYSLGALALLILLIPYFKSTNAEKAEHPPTGILIFTSRIFASLAIITILTLGLYHIPLANSDTKLSSAVDKPKPEELRTQQELAQIFPGRILFDSNRSGTFGIYSIGVDGKGLSTIVDTEFHEEYPDPSPDGKQIVYSRARSLARYAPSEIWLVNSDGSNPRLLIDDGDYPTFSTGGKTIYFEQQSSRVMSIDSDGKNLQEIFPASNSSFKGYKTIKPRVSRDGNYLMFTSDNKGRWNAWYANLLTKNATHISHGCEPSPFNDGNRMAYIQKQNVKERSGIAAIDIKTGKREIFHDLDKPFGHEYFPTLVSNDKFLLYGACREGEHSHEESNYQIFLHELSSGKNARITFDKFTNRWPKLLPQ